MAITFQDSIDIFAVASAPSPQTAVFTDVGTGVSRQAVICIMATGADPTVTSVTVGTDALALISGTEQTAGAGNVHTEIWGGTLTVTGSQTLTITFSVTVPNLGAYNIVFAGTDLVYQGTLVAGTSSPISRSVTSPNGNRTVSCLAALGDSGLPTTSQTLTQREGPGPTFATDRSASGLTDPTHTWTAATSFTDAAVAAVSLRLAGGGFMPTTVASVLTGVLAIPSVGTRLTVPTP